MTDSIYLDYAATTPVDPRVLEKMLPFLMGESGSGAVRYGSGFGNASSITHQYGKVAKQAIEAARESVAGLVNCAAKNIIWTSGATESNNLALKGVAEFYKRYGNHIVTCQTEHRAVLDVCLYLASQGFEITYLKPEADGLINPAVFEAALKPETILVSLMQVNNETGVVQDIATLAQMTQQWNNRRRSPQEGQHKVLFHVDAAQSAGKIPIDLQTLPVDLMSFSAHKLYGPKGIGALYINDTPKVRLSPQLHGGGQEQGLRPGTLANHQIVGMGEAFRIAALEMDEERQRLSALRDRFWTGISECPQVYLNGHLEARIPGILNIRFESQEKETLLAGLQALAISTSSACASSTMETSHVLRAMGLKSELTHRSLRFSMGRYTTAADIDRAVQLIRDLF